ncbi:MAG: D-glycero-beta-D-manno-heptose 1,7-bisphosphate 7-phosphatase [Betaproteobacteria bacterium]
MRRAAAFLDRDGVINIDHGYVSRREQFDWVPGVLPAATRLHRAGYALVVVTNQSGIGRGLYSEASFATLTGWMRDEFDAAGAPLAGVYYCPHHPVDAIAPYRIACDCRKPAPGMLLRAARELDLDLSRSLMFGDRESDLQAAQAAGVQRRYLLGTDGISLPAAPATPIARASFPSLAAAVDVLLPAASGACSA